MGSEALSTHAAGAQHDGATARLSVQADGRDHVLVHAVGPAVGLDFVANLDSRIDGNWRGAGEDGPVSEEHRCGTVIPVIRVARVDQGLARGRGRSQGRFVHAVTVVTLDCTRRVCPQMPDPVLVPRTERHLGAATGGDDGE